MNTFAKSILNYFATYIEYAGKRSESVILAQVARLKASLKVLPIDTPAPPWCTVDRTGISSVISPFGGNLYQEHKYIWSLTELKERGFRNIRGIELKGMSGNLWGILLRSFIGPLFGAFAFLGTLFSYHIPKIASGIIAWREIQ